MLMLTCKLTWSLCSATSSAKPLLGVGMTFANVALFGSGSCEYKYRDVPKTSIFPLPVGLFMDLLFLSNLYSFGDVSTESNSACLVVLTVPIIQDSKKICLLLKVGTVCSQTILL